MRQRSALLVAALVVVVAVPALAGAQSSGFVSVTDVTVEPGQPAPGETVTITPTIEYSNDSSDPSSYRISDVAVRSSGSAEEYARVENVGTLQPGESRSVPIPVTFEEAGTKQLSVQVYGDGARHTYPVTVTVGDNHPGIDVDTDDPVAGVDQPMTVTLANGLEDDVNNVKVDVGGSGVTDADGSSVLARLESGQTATLNETYRVAEPGSHTVETTVTYTTSGGTVRETTERTRVVAQELDDDVVLNADVVGSGSGRAIEVQVLNRGNAPIERVSLEGVSEAASVRPTIVQRIPAGESETVRLNFSVSEEAADVDLEATYDVGDDRRTVVESMRVSSASGVIDLTGVDVGRDAGNRVHITGSAANVGLSDADSVMVAVADTDRVTPASPSKEYFIGTVPSSDFVSFDLYATTTGNVTEVPIELSYIVDGERRERIVSVDAPPSREPAQGTEAPREARGGDDDGGNGLLVPVAVGALALLVVGGVVARYYFAGGDDEV